MHSRELLDVIFLLGSFPVKKNNIEYMRDKGLVLLIKTSNIPKKRKMHYIQTVCMNSMTKCTVFTNTHFTVHHSSLALV